MHKLDWNSLLSDEPEGGRKGGEQGGWVGLIYCPAEEAEDAVARQ